MSLARMRTPGEPRRLEVQFETQPIKGRVYDRETDGHRGRAFSGWLGLMSAIEAARGARPARQQKGDPR